MSWGRAKEEQRGGDGLRCLGAQAWIVPILLRCCHARLEDPRKNPEKARDVIMVMTTGLDDKLLLCMARQITSNMCDLIVS